MKRISIVSVPVSDQQRARDFYVRVLGFRVLWDRSLEDGTRWLQLGLPGSDVTISLVTWYAMMPPGTLQGLQLVTDDLDQTEVALRRAGVTVGDVADLPTGRFLRFADLDGNGWVLHEPVYKTAEMIEAEAAEEEEALLN